MSYLITFPNGAMTEAPYASSWLKTLALALTAIDVMYLQAHPEIPTLHDAGVELLEQVPNRDAPFSAETWKDIPSCLMRDKRTGKRTASARAIAAWAAAESVTKANTDGSQAYQAALQTLLPASPMYKPVHRVTIALGLFDGDKERDLSHASLNVLLAALMRVDMTYLQLHPETPMLYQSGVFYQEEPPGQEDWQDIPTCLRMRASDCEDVACWRAAELNVRYAVKATPKFIFEKRPDGSYLYHIQTQLPDGRIEDPSRMLGMR